MQPRCGRGEHVDALVQVAIGGGQADLVVRGELSDAGGVAEPAQHQNRLLSHVQSPSPRACPALKAFGVERLARRATVDSPIGSTAV